VRARPRGKIVLADQTVGTSCGSVNHGTKFCPECGAPIAPGSDEEPSPAQAPISDALEADTVVTTPDQTSDGGERATQPLRRAVPSPAPAIRGLSIRRLTVWVGIACLLAIIGIAIGAVGVVQALDAKNDQSTLRAELAGLRHRTSGDEARIGQVAQQMTRIPGRATMAAAQADIAAARAQLTGLSRAVHGIQGQDARYTNCIPELQTELSGLTINWTINAVDVNQSSFFINNSSQVSHDCSKLLYGT
jgi:hypothetical protein